MKYSTIVEICILVILELSTTGWCFRISLPRMLHKTRHRGNPSLGKLLLPSKRKSVISETWTDKASPNFTSNDEDYKVAVIVTSEYIVQEYLRPLQQSIGATAPIQDTFKHVADLADRFEGAVLATSIKDKFFFHFAIQLVQERNRYAHPRTQDIELPSTLMLKVIAEGLPRNCARRFVRFVERIEMVRQSFPRELSLSKPRPAHLLSHLDTKIGLAIINLYQLAHYPACLGKIAGRLPSRNTAAPLSKSECRAFHRMLKPFRNAFAHPKVSPEMFCAYATRILRQSKYYSPLLSEIVADIKRNGSRI